VSQVLPERRGPDGQRSGPFAEFDQVSERMRRLLDQTFGGMLAESSGWIPAVDIEEQDDAYVVEAELPGVRREDVEIELSGSELMITGEAKEREREGIVRRRTRRVGRFEYRVRLPEQVDAEQIEAKLEHGVLTVRVPKSERAQRHKIEIQSA